ncbi:squalene epoxidase-domain-containing protein [Mycena floridula]|nr:squalene epoxidase-domain-containing protein [Mycena floridula]
MEEIHQHDVVIVGAGIAGCSMAHALSTLKRATPLRIALLERSLAVPDRIVGELLQPGGVMALQELGMHDCLNGIDAIPVQGYCVVDDGRPVHIPYPNGHQGRSFHHGGFVENLRQAAKRAKGVDVVEATVTELVEMESTKKIVGVRTVKKLDDGSEQKALWNADLVIVADGCFSNFRTSVMRDRGCKPVTKSHFIGLVLKDAVLPIPQHGTVALIKDGGPVLLYQISEHDTRILIDLKQPLPSDLKSHILNNVVPQLPTSLHLSIQNALENDRPRKMPNSFLPSVTQGESSSTSVQGAFLLGDAWNMRHPLTGGGMTVAFNDVVLLRDLLGSIHDLSDWNQVKEALSKWHWTRKPLSSTINILSVALYDLFGADGEELAVLRTGCFKYFERGGECINGPVSLLSGIAPSPYLLFFHFFSVAFYSIWVMFTHPRPVQRHSSDEPVIMTPSVFQYPMLFIKGIRVFATAVLVFGPLVWSEIRWWSPDDQRTARKYMAMAIATSVLMLPLVALVLALLWAPPASQTSLLLGNISSFIGDQTPQELTRYIGEYSDLLRTYYNKIV